MANGDSAAAAGFPVVPETALVKMGYDEINLTRDLVAGTTPIVRGGTGATTAPQALTNLAAVPMSQVYNGTGSVGNKIPRYDGSGRLICGTPTASNHAAPKIYVDTALRDTVEALPKVVEAVEALTARVAALEAAQPPGEA